jgi:TatD DNase family protein
MYSVPYINVHTHSAKKSVQTITVQNIFPGDRFAAFSGRNFYSVGLHPWFLKSPEENNIQLNLVEEALEFDPVIFVGECGVDKTRPAFDEQMRVFKAQVFMAEEFKKPLVIHCVKAYNEVLELHDKLHPETDWILHGYSGGVEMTKQLEKRGLFFSFGAVLLKSGSKAIDSFRYLPVEKIFFETDEFEGNVKQIYSRGAKLKNVSLETMSKAVWANFNRIENIAINSF